MIDKTEEKIRKNEQQFQYLFNNMNEGVAFHKLLFNDNGIPEDYIIIETNPAFGMILGISHGAVEGKTSREVYGVETPPFLEIYSKVALTSGKEVFETYFPPLEKHFLISVYGTGQDGFATVFEDITERKRSNAELNEREVQYRNLADSGLALIWKADTEKLCNYFNEPWLKFTGRTMQQEMGNGWAEGVHPDDFDRCLNTYVTAFDRREIFIMEYRLRHHSGEYRWLLDKGTPNYNVNGEFVGYIGHCFDITDRVQAEEAIKLKNEELQKTVAEKDKFFSIIAHDLKSPFNSFLGYTEMMVAELENMSLKEIQSMAVNMKKSANNLYTLLENLLLWSSIQRGLFGFKPDKYPLKPLMEESLQSFFEMANKKEIEVKKMIPDDLIIYSDPNMLESIVRNLASNAVKFTPKGGKIEIIAKVKSGNFIEIAVSDNGIGMNKEMIEKLFHFDDKTNRKGTEGEPSTGLGLIICKDLVEKNGGKIWVESNTKTTNDKFGTTIYFTVPQVLN